MVADILRNTTINRARKRTPLLLHDQNAVLGTLAAGGADGRDGPAETALAQLPDARVVDALRRLSCPHRAVVTLDVDGLSYRQAAEILEVPIGTVMSRLHRARRNLHGHLERSGHPGLTRIAGRPAAAEVGDSDDGPAAVGVAAPR